MEKSDDNTKLKYKANKHINWRDSAKYTGMWLSNDMNQLHYYIL